MVTFLKEQSNIIEFN